MAFAYDAPEHRGKNYDALLAKAIAGLPGAAAEARREVYDRARAALRKQLQVVRPAGDHVDALAEERALNEAIARVEATADENSASLSPPPQPQKSGSWLTDLLWRASHDAPLASKPRARSVAPAGAATATDVARVFAPKSAETKEATAEPRAAAAANDSRGAKSFWQRYEIGKILRKLVQDSSGVEASAVILEDGAMVACALSPHMEESRVAGMAATLQKLGSRAASELRCGALREVMIRGEDGYALVISTKRDALLLALGNESTKLGLVFFDMQEAIKALRGVL